MTMHLLICAFIISRGLRFKLLPKILKIEDHPTPEPIRIYCDLYAQVQRLLLRACIWLQCADAYCSQSITIASSLVTPGVCGTKLIVLLSGAIPSVANA